ncbi:MAG: hypothetical protein MI724_04665 [Spirochaetales bacterium]|nr:hypothetical protein [Spirochaetales bacterium]
MTIDERIQTLRTEMHDIVHRQLRGRELPHDERRMAYVVSEIDRLTAEREQNAAVDSEAGTQSIP